MTQDEWKTDDPGTTRANVSEQARFSPPFDPPFDSNANDFERITAKTDGQAWQ
jgi:hypothetical protein